VVVLSGILVSRWVKRLLSDPIGRLVTSAKAAGHRRGGLGEAERHDRKRPRWRDDMATETTSVRSRRAVLPLCWAAVLLDGFDLVVLGHPRDVVDEEIAADEIFVAH
jgi:hypothetical protein